jgi:hypothetical protein
MKIKSFLTALALPLAVSAIGVVGASTSASALTTCDAGSFKPTLVAGTVRPDGYISCTASIYRTFLKVSLEKWTGSAWVPWTTYNSGWVCTNTAVCAPATPRPFGYASTGLYRTVTSGNVQATPGSGVFPVTTRYSSALSI